MIRICFVTDLYKIVPKHSASLDRYTSSVSLKIQGQSDHGLGNESSSAGKQDENIVREKEKPYWPTKSVNTFSGTFHTNGGKMIQGNEFNSGGGSMSF